MNILIIGWGHKDRISGGSTIFTFRCMQNLSKDKNNKITYLYTGDFDSTGRTKIVKVKSSNDNIKYYSLKNISLSCYDFSNPVNDCFNDKIEKELEMFLCKNRFDIVHIFHLRGWTVSILKIFKKFKLPVVMSIVDYWLISPDIHNRYLKDKRFLLEHYPEKKELYEYRNKYVRNYFNKYCDLAIVCSPTSKDILTKNGIKKSLLRVIYYPVVKSNICNNSHSLGNTIKLGYTAGVFNEEKGFNFLYETFSKYFGGNNNIELIIYGLKKSELIKKSYKLHNNIILKPRYTDKTVAEIHSEFDFIVIPSQIDDFGPMTLFQSFACKRPVIASRVGGISGLVKNNINGFLYKKDSSIQFRNILMKIIDRKVNYEFLQNNALRCPGYKEYTDRLMKMYFNVSKIKKKISGKKNIFLQKEAREYFVKGLTDYCTYIKKRYKEIIKQLRKSDRIVIYGAGKSGMELGKYLKREGFRNIKYADTYLKSNEKYISMNELSEDSFDKIIAASMGYQEEIYNLLIDKNISRDKVLLLH